MAARLLLFATLVAVTLPSCMGFRFFTIEVIRNANCRFGQLSTDVRPNFTCICGYYNIFDMFRPNAETIWTCLGFRNNPVVVLPTTTGRPTTASAPTVTGSSTTVGLPGPGR